MIKFLNGRNFYGLFWNGAHWCTVTCCGEHLKRWKNKNIIYLFKWHQKTIKSNLFTRGENMEGEKGRERLKMVVSCEGIRCKCIVIPLHFLWDLFLWKRNWCWKNKMSVLSLGSHYFLSFHLWLSIGSLICSTFSTAICSFTLIFLFFSPKVSITNTTTTTRLG
jgi:hypothetical protein